MYTEAAFDIEGQDPDLKEAQELLLQRAEAEEDRKSRNYS